MQPQRNYPDNREVLHPATEEEWLEMRKQDITSTMCPALFGLSPYITKFELYHAKKNGIEVPFQTNERIERGKRIEAYIAEEVCQEQGWTPRKMDEYIRIPSLGLGSSFDFEAICDDRGRGILEIKAVDAFQMRNWKEDCMPAHFEVQIQHELLLSASDWGVVACCATIHDTRLFFRKADKDMQAAIINASQKFWLNVANGIEPDPNFQKDGQVIDLLYRDIKEETLDLTEDEYIEELIAQYEYNATQEKTHSLRKAELKARIHHLLGEKAYGKTSQHIITATRTKDTPPKIITDDMVGNEIGGKQGYRQLKIKERKDVK